MENAFGISPLQKGKGQLVIERNFFEINFDATVFTNDANGVVKNRKGAEAQKVHLEEAYLFKILHGPLGGGDGGIAGSGIIAFSNNALQRGIVHERAIGDDHPGGMCSGVSVGSFQLNGDIKKALDFRIAIVSHFEVAAFRKGFG